MAANTNPIFLRLPKTQWVSTGTAANTNLDGTGTSALLFTADATNGSRVDRLVFEHLGTNVATVVRIFINNGQAPGTPANNTLYLEQTMAANTLSQSAASTRVVFPADLALPPGYTLRVTTGTALAAGIQVTAIGGDY